jgi:hypothetical protein
LSLCTTNFNLLRIKIYVSFVKWSLPTIILNIFNNMNSLCMGVLNGGLYDLRYTLKSLKACSSCQLVIYFQSSGWPSNNIQRQ